MAKLVLIAGHGAGDPGACAGGQQEATLVRQLAARIKALGGADVDVLDTSRNWYADKGILSLQVPKGSMVLELHMDSGPSGAKGAHVIIKNGFNADTFDNKLAANLAKIFPGRSNILVGRSDLANVNRAASRGINYRLAECGFISDAGDRSTMVSRMDEVARAILDAAGIKVTQQTTQQVTQQTIQTTPTTSTQASGLAVDGSFGPATVRALQKALGTTVDGVVSNQPAGNAKYVPSAVSGTWRWMQSGYKAGSSMVRALQAKLGVTADGWWGKATTTAYQRKLGVSADGSFGPASCKAMQAALNKGNIW